MPSIRITYNNWITTSQYLPISMNFVVVCVFVLLTTKKFTIYFQWCWPVHKYFRWYWWWWRWFHNSSRTKKFNYKCDNWNRFLYNGFLCVYRFNIWSLKGVKAFMQITSNWLIFTDVGNLVFVVLFARNFFIYFFCYTKHKYTDTTDRHTHTNIWYGFPKLFLIFFFFKILLIRKYWKYWKFCIILFAVFILMYTQKYS